MSAESKSCPFCGEEILAVAIVCKHCKSSLNANKSIREKSTLGTIIGNGIKIVCGVLVALFVIGFAFPTPDNAAAPGPSNVGTSQIDIKATESAILKEILRNWSESGNGGYDSIKLYSSELVDKGTIPVSPTFVTAAKGRTDAYLACYSYNQKYELLGNHVDSDFNMCIYYVKHPDGSRFASAHRGRDNISALRDIMENDTFQSNQPSIAAASADLSCLSDGTTSIKGVLTQEANVRADGSRTIANILTTKTPLCVEEYSPQTDKTVELMVKRFQVFSPEFTVDSYVLKNVEVSGDLSTGNLSQSYIVRNAIFVESIKVR